MKYQKKYMLYMQYRKIHNLNGIFKVNNLENYLGHLLIARKFLYKK